MMPDCHLGAAGPIGFTGRFHDAVIPNIVGVDIGCGMTAYPLGISPDIDLEALDAFVRENIPLGFNRRNFKDKNERMEAYHFFREHSAYIEDEKTKFISDALKTSFDASEVLHRIIGEIPKIHPDDQLATLGGGNHFIEIGKCQHSGQTYLIVHSGSRNFGLKVANHYQKTAKKICEEMGIDIPPDLSYLPMSAGGYDYIKDMKIAQRYARSNRLLMIDLILGHLNIEHEPSKVIVSTHNYISERDNIIRKGAISAHQGETVIIPMNMAYGTIIGTGKGNSKFNFSAPHGAGRKYGRKEMYRKLERKEMTMEAFREAMKNVFSSSVNEETFDEAPFAYKEAEGILKHLKETVDIKMTLKPIYNLKDDTKK